MWLRKSADYMEAGISPVISAVGKIGAGVIGVMMLLTTADVVGRRVFNHPLVGSFELSVLMLVVITFFSIAHCQLRRGHVTVDILVNKFGRRAQDITESVMYFVFLVISCFLTWQYALYAGQLWQNKLATGILLVPEYPFIFLGVLGCALLSIIVLIHWFQFIAGAWRK